VEEGMQACADYLRTQNPWASEHRTPEILRILEDYGTAAQRLLPHLKETASMFEQGENDFPKRLSEQKARAVRQQIEKIEAAKESPVLRSLE
jgi:predicted house-cleaning NTP pyrophosphatase (Maf/HAM1 superfamily)